MTFPPCVLRPLSQISGHLEVMPPCAPCRLMEPTASPELSPEGLCQIEDKEKQCVIQNAQHYGIENITIK